MSTNDDFLARLEGELREVTAADGDLAQQEEDLRRRRGEVRTRMGDLQRVRDVYRELMDMRPVQAPSKGLFDAVDAIVAPLKGTIADIAYAVMQQQGGRMRVGDIQEELTKIGKLKGGHGDYGTLFGSLSRDYRFTKAGRGMFQVVPPDAPTAPEPPSEQSQSAVPG